MQVGKDTAGHFEAAGRPVGLLGEGASPSHGESSSALPALSSATARLGHSARKSCAGANAPPSGGATCAKARETVHFAVGRTGPVLACELRTMRETVRGPGEGARRRRVGGRLAPLAPSEVASRAERAVPLEDFNAAGRKGEES